jgi:putative membrane protein
LQRFLPLDRYQRALCGFFLCFLAASCLAPPYPDYLLMQHVPTVLAALALGYTAHRFPVSRGSFTSIVAFLCLHTVGARYLYSYVPYDAWTRAVFGFEVNATMGWERNHYDRLVHFCYGLLISVPVQQFERRHFGLSPALAGVLAVECILATSGAYEIVEWLVAAVFTPDWAEAFLGQQGDHFDAQKDMALATAGAIIAILTAAGWENWLGSVRREGGNNGT